MNDLDVKLSDISNTVTTRIGFPDYNNAEQISTNPRDMSYVSSKKGWMFIHVWCAEDSPDRGTFAVTIGSMTFSVLTGHGDNGVKSSNIVLPVNENTTITGSGWCEGGQAWFVPCA